MAPAAALAFGAEELPAVATLAVEAATPLPAAADPVDAVALVPTDDVAVEAVLATTPLLAAVAVVDVVVVVDFAFDVAVVPAVLRDVDAVVPHRLAAAGADFAATGAVGFSHCAVFVAAQ